MSEKVYVGNGKEIETQYGKMMKISFSEEDVQKLQENLKNKWVNCVVKERREPSEKGTTHYLEIDQFLPNKEYKKKDEVSTEEDINNLPF